jgi:hypothetical protein
LASTYARKFFTVIGALSDQSSALMTPIEVSIVTTGPDGSGSGFGAAGPHPAVNTIAASRHVSIVVLIGISQFLALFVLRAM